MTTVPARGEGRCAEPTGAGQRGARCHAASIHAVGSQPGSGRTVLAHDAPHCFSCRHICHDEGWSYCSNLRSYGIGVTAWDGEAAAAACGAFEIQPWRAAARAALASTTGFLVRLADAFRWRQA